jgi:hypothetical protein
VKKSRSPQQKKALAYTRDHYVSAHESRHAYRNNWHIKKARLHHVSRQLAREALHRLEICRDEASIEKAPAEVTAGQLRKADPRLKFFKSHVWTLAEYLKHNRNGRKEREETNRSERLERRAKYEEMIVALEKDPRSPKARKLLREISEVPSFVWQFLRENPEWKPRLQAKLAEVKRATAKVAKQRQVKAEQIQRTRTLLESVCDRAGRPDSGAARRA